MKGRESEPQHFDISLTESLNLSKEEKAMLDGINIYTNYSKGTILLKEGGISSKSYYIIKGCVRQYFIKDGEEKTVFFYTKNQSISLSVNNQVRTTSKYYLECIEDSFILETLIEKEREFCDRFPRFEAMCRKNTEKLLLEYQEMFAIYMTSSPEERYLNLLETKPDLLNRVPQYQLASYLGVMPESLSRIRKRLASKDK